MSLDELYTDLKNSAETIKIVKSLTRNIINRNLFPMTLIQFYSGKAIEGDSLTTDYSGLISIISAKLDQADIHEESVTDESLRQALWFAKDKDGHLDNSLLAKWLVVILCSTYMPKIDENIKHLDDIHLLDRLELAYKSDLLVDISSSSFELRKHGLIVSNDKLTYPHQFLRRYYSANFVDMLVILSDCIKNGLAVKLRLDPLRSYTEPRFYQNIFEADHWHGKPFNENILMSADKKELFTIHRTDNYNFSSYPVAFTIFRSNMMDKGLRQFTIEEFTPKIDPSFKGKITPGFGEKYCIQKFAHFVFDQASETISHVDGAVRVFSLDEYDAHYKVVMKGRDPGSKIGKRHKLFLVEGNLSLERTQNILYEFFRYNQHLQEYFVPASIAA